MCARSSKTPGGPSVDRSLAEAMTQGETRGNLEDSLQEMLLRALSARLGEAPIEEGCRLFAVIDGCGGGKCEREGLLNYDVEPAQATMSHRTDILLTRADGRVVAVEVKVGTITDAFKSRGYDMLHPSNIAVTVCRACSCTRICQDLVSGLSRRNAFATCSTASSVATSVQPTTTSNSSGLPVMR